MTTPHRKKHGLTATMPKPRKQVALKSDGTPWTEWHTYASSAWDFQGEVSSMLLMGRQHKEWLVQHRRIWYGFSNRESLYINNLIASGCPWEKALALVEAERKDRT